MIDRQKRCFIVTTPSLCAVPSDEATTTDIVLYTFKSDTVLETAVSSRLWLLFTGATLTS